MGSRHQDDGSALYAWADPEVLVVCPRCEARRKQVLAVLDALAQR